MKTKVTSEILKRLKEIHIEESNLLQERCDLKKKYVELTLPFEYMDDVRVMDYDGGKPFWTLGVFVSGEVREDGMIWCRCRKVKKDGTVSRDFFNRTFDFGNPLNPDEIKAV